MITRTKSCLEGSRSGFLGGLSLASSVVVFVGGSGCGGDGRFGPTPSGALGGGPVGTPRRMPGGGVGVFVAGAVEVLAASGLAGCSLADSLAGSLAGSLGGSLACLAMNASYSSHFFRYSTADSKIFLVRSSSCWRVRLLLADTPSEACKPALAAITVTPLVGFGITDTTAP